MKGLFLFLSSWMMRLIGYIYPYTLGRQFRVYRNILYTMWIRNFIGSVGGHTSIHYPCSLQGGGARRIHIGSNTCIQSRCILGCWERYNAYDGQQEFTPEIIIGNYCSIGEYNQITSISKITIGDGFLTGRFVYIGDNAHGGLSWDEADIPPLQRHLTSKGEIVIGKNVWIGDKVTILGGVTIGDNVIIGSNSVVTHNVRGNCVIAGNPAKLIKELKR